jgi:hypothetical protein
MRIAVAWRGEIIHGCRIGAYETCFADPRKQEERSINPGSVPPLGAASASPEGASNHPAKGNALVLQSRPHIGLRLGRRVPVALATGTRRPRRGFPHVVIDSRADPGIPGARLCWANAGPSARRTWAEQIATPVSPAKITNSIDFAQATRSVPATFTAG